MTRAFLLLPLAALAAGCYSSNFCGSNGVAFYWQFQDSLGGIHGNFTPANPGCADVGVDSVDVTVDGVTRTVGCTNIDQSGQQAPSIAIADLPPGTWSWSVQGFRGPEEVFADGGTVFVPDCDLAAVDATMQALSPQTLVIYYSFAGFVGCPVDVASLAYELRNGAGTVVVSAHSGFACDPVSTGFVVSNTLGNPLSLSLGAYGLRFLEAYDGLGNLLFKTCGLTVNHDGTVQAIDLAADPAGTPCP